MAAMGMLDAAAGRFLSWKHWRHNTGRPCVGLNGTVVSIPHSEHCVRVSVRESPAATGPVPFAAAASPERRLLQGLHRLGSFLNCLSKKKSCSPAVKMNSPWQSTQLRILSRNCSCMALLPWSIQRKRAGSCGTRGVAFRGKYETGGLNNMNPAGAQVKQKIAQMGRLKPGEGRINRYCRHHPDQDSSARRHPNPSPLLLLVLFLTNLLTVTLASQRFFHALLLAWLQIEGVTLDLFDNVFGLHLALKAPQCVLKRFTFLNTNLCQGKYTSQSGLIGYHPE
jgi:hypothetical protein